jgi:hypothetical protein
MIAPLADNGWAQPCRLSTDPRYATAPGGVDAGGWGGTRFARRRRSLQSERDPQNRLSLSAKGAFYYGAGTPGDPAVVVDDLAWVVVRGAA